VIVDRENSGTFVVGAVLVTIGAALLLDRMGVLPWTGQWSVWPLLLIGYGVVNLAESPWRGTRGLFPIALGLWLWATQAGWLEFRTSWPLIFVMLGLAVMWQTWAAPADAADRVLDPRRRRHRSPLVGFAIVAAILAATTIDAGHYGFRTDTSAAASEPSGNRLRVMAMMSQATRTPTQSFTGADVVTVMGESTIDLRQASVADGEDVTIDLFGMMGSIVIRVPAGWTVDNRAFPVMAQIVDRRGLPEPAPRVRNRGRGRDDDWVSGSNGANGANGSKGAKGAKGANGSPSAAGEPLAPSAPLEPLAPLAPLEPVKPHRLVLTGFITMGNVVIR
jgi:hypothetical protein